MTDWPEAVRLYAALSAEWDSTGDVDSAEVLDRADAAIAALKEMVLETKHGLKMANEDIDTAMRQAEKAEAEVEELKMWLDTAHDASRMFEAEAERLKWMLDEAYRQVPGAREWKQHDWLADLAARWEKEQHGTA